MRVTYVLPFLHWIGNVDVGQQLPLGQQMVVFANRLVIFPPGTTRELSECLVCG